MMTLRIVGSTETYLAGGHVHSRWGYRARHRPEDEA